MTKRKKLIFISLGVCFCLAVFLLVALLYAIETDPAQKMVQRQINSRMPGAVRWEGFSFSLLKGRAEIRDFTLTSPSGEELVGFDRLFADIAPAELFGGRLTVETLTIEKPRTALLTDKNGRLNLLDAFPPAGADAEKAPAPEKKGLPLQVTVREFKVRQGAFRYTSEAPEMAARLTGVDISGSADATAPSGSVAVHIAEGGFKMQGIDSPIADFTLEASLENGSVRIPVLSVRTRDSGISGKGGAASVFSDPSPDATLDIRLSLSDIQKMLSLEQELTGDVSSRITLKKSPDNPDVTLTLTYGGGVLNGRPVEGVDLAAHMKDRILAVERFDVKAAGGAVGLTGRIDLQAAFPNGFLAGERDFSALSYRLETVGKAVRLNRLPGLNGRVSGAADLRLSVSGAGVSPEKMTADAEMTVDLRQLQTEQIASPMDVRMTARAGASDGVVELGQLQVQAGNMDVDATGRYAMDSRDASAALNVASQDLGKMLSDFGIQNVKGAFTLAADLAGSIDRPEIDMRLNARNLAYQTATIGDVTCKASLSSDGTATVSELVLENRGSHIEGGGEVQLFSEGFAVNEQFPMDVALVLRNIETRDFMESAAATGVINGKLTMKGPKSQLRADLRLQGENVGLPSFRFGDVDADIRLADGELLLDRVRVVNNRSTLQVSGRALLAEKESLTPVEDPSFDLSVSSETLYLEDFFKELAGTLSLDAELNGTVSRPRGNFSLSADALKIGYQTIDRISLSGALDGEKITAENLTAAVAPDETIEASGWISMDKSFEVALRSKGISLERIDMITPEQNISGAVVLDLSGKGTLDNPEVTGRITLERPVIRGKSLDDFDIRVTVQDHLARMSGALNFDVTGTFDLKKKDFSAAVEFDKTDLGPYFQMAERPDLEGVLSGTVTAAGNAEALEDMTAEADLSGLRVLRQGRELLKGDRIRATMTGRELVIPGFSLALLEAGEIKVSGAAAIGGDIDISVDGRIPVRLANEFVETVNDAGGDIRIDADIGGSFEKPDVRADITLGDVEVTVPNLMQRMHGVSGKISVTPGAAVIENIEGRLDAGRFNASGAIRLDEAFRPSDVDVTLQARALPIQVPETLETVLNADLRAKGTANESRITGEIVILEGIYYRDVNLNMILLEEAVRKKRELAPKKEELAQPFLKNMNLDIAVTRRNPFLIDNNLAELETSPDLRITGTLNRPVVSGRAEVESGTVTFQKKTFEVKKGVIDFVNPYKIEPVIDIQSQARIRKWTVRLAVSGTPDQLRIKLTSDPPEEHGDLLSLIVFGKTNYELMEGEEGASKSPAMMAAGLVAETFGDDIKDATGLDIIEVEEGTDAEGEEDVKITIGKELSRRLTVKYQVESADGEMVQRAVSEYKLLEHLLMSGFQDSKGVFGGELQFRLEFR